MRDKRSYIGITIIVVLAAAIITIIVMSVSAKKDVEQYQEIQQSVSDSEAIQQETRDYINTFNEQNQSEYDSLDEQLGE